jgi:hypothetical protein
VAECAGLENRCVRKGTEGSNPSLSAFFPVFSRMESHAGRFSETSGFPRKTPVYAPKTCSYKTISATCSMWKGKNDFQAFWK